MKRLIIAALCFMFISLSACGKQTDVQSGEVITSAEKAVSDGLPQFDISSDDLHDGVWDTVITNTDYGKNVSPQLSWEPVEGAKSYVIYMVDTSAGNWLHWRAGNITETTLEQGSATECEYIGPYPPSGTHNYITTCGDNVNWSYNDETLTIYGEGEMYDYGDMDGNYSLPYKDLVIKKIVIEDGVTHIGNCAFFQLSDLREISISDTVESIGEAAFFECKNLTSVSMSKSVTIIDRGAFYYCEKLAEIAIPDSVRTIGSNSFEGCTRAAQILTVICPLSI